MKTWYRCTIELVINHLLCAADIFIMSKATTGSAETIRRVMINTQNGTGLVMNKYKSILMFGKGLSIKM